ncbi:MAG: chromate transporter [Clostridiales Family XIII bacterium]|jgi:chromate transporter|nr:chromate transporter [Clostridiales Family XIII bacterium]
MNILTLFLKFMLIGVFTIGGGYASLPLIERYIVDGGLMTMPQFTDLVALSQMTPGPIFINAATFSGMNIAGIGGAAAATIGSVVPSFIIVSILSSVYVRYEEAGLMRSALEGVRPAVMGLIAATAVSMIFEATLWPVTLLSIGDAKKALFTGEGFTGLARVAAAIPYADLIAVCIIAGGVVLMRAFKVKPIFIMVGAAAVGGVLYLVL